ncbi:T9SS type A sorting domain-containing protein [Flavobacterium sp. N1994]|uniref:T9SS type A sorting domain-containing protein n=1 Tax=Flavobacterium sp. N1994 TaxID=2986827 RepID=UPI002223790B|nr:T9SS type A sorting domain-containing protein [Flavobacterium sp. N1994]
MKKLIFLFFAINCFSQAPTIQWQKTYGGSEYDMAYTIKPTFDGGYIAAGVTSSIDGDVVSLHGNGEGWIVKVNNVGAIEWQKAIGGTNMDEVNSIWQTTDGGYIATGYSSSNNGDITLNQGYEDLFVARLSATGSLLWMKTYGGSGWDEGTGIQQCTDGGFIVCGTTTSSNGNVSFNHGSDDFWLLKLNTDGNIQWEKTYGGTNSDNAFSLVQTKDGGYAITGYTYSMNGDVTGNLNCAFWIVKTNGAGTLQWQKAVGSYSSISSYCIKQTIDDGFIIAGDSSGVGGAVTVSYGNDDYWVVKLSAAGTLQWQKSLGGTYRDIAYGIDQTSDGGYIVSGRSESTDYDVLGNHGYDDYWIVKLNPTGAILWQKSLGGTSNDEGREIHQTLDGGFIIAGRTSTATGDVTSVNGGGDFWIVKLNPDPLNTINFEKRNLTVYPNPTSSHIQLQLPEEVEIIKISVTDVLGKKVLEQFGNMTNLNIDSLSSGTYIIQVFSSETTYHCKFIKE